MPTGSYIRTKEYKIKHSQFCKGKSGVYKHPPQCGFQKGHNIGKRFKENNIPWNKNKKLPQLSGKNSPLWKEKIKKKCLSCGKIFYVVPANKDIAKYCSHKCHWDSKKGSFIDKDGYILIRKPEHPFCTKTKYVRRSHLIMEQHLRKTQPNHPALIEIDGIKYLRPKLIVHHKGTKYPMGSLKDKQDDRPENLQAVTRKEHIKIHLKK